MNSPRCYTQEIQLQKGDQVYLFTDGFADQFGAPSLSGKKFKYKPFKKLLLEHAHLSLAEQKNVIIKTFDHWKAHKDQVDDVLVLGVKL